MSLSDKEIQHANALLGQFCEDRSIQDEVKLEYQIRGNRITLTESRPFFIDPSKWNDFKVAQFEFNFELGIWNLYWYDMKNKRHPYPTRRSKDTLDKLLLEVIKDPTGIFWE
jgi:hypothetical protein